MAKSKGGWAPAREIEHPEAYAKAIQNRIRMNKAKTNAKKLVVMVENEPLEFKQWLGLAPFSVETGEAYAAAWKAAEEAQERYAAEQKIWIARIKETGNKTLPAHPECVATHEALRVAQQAVYAAQEAHDAAHFAFEKKFWKTYGSVPEFIRIRFWIAFA